MGESANFDNFKGCEVADLDLDVEFRNAKYMWEEMTNMTWKPPNVADIICEQLWVSITFSNTNTCFFSGNNVDLFSSSHFVLKD